MFTPSLIGSDTQLNRNSYYEASVQRPAQSVEQRPLAPVLGVPDGELAPEGAEPGDRPGIQPGTPGRAAQRLERRGRIGVQAQVEFRNLDNVAAGTPRQLECIEWRHAAARSSARQKVSTSCAPEQEYRPSNT